MSAPLLTLAAAVICLVVSFVSEPGVGKGKGLIVFFVLTVACLAMFAAGVINQDEIRDRDLLDRGVLEYRHDGPLDDSATLTWTVPRKEQVKP